MLVFLLALLSKASGQVVPEIKVTDTVICLPGKVEVKILNCTSCVKFEWQIGAGAPFKPTTINNYQTVVTSGGWYDVTVVIHFASGARMAIGKKNAFFGRPSPTANFVVNKRVFCNGMDTLRLTDSTPRVVSRDWLIDGNIFYNSTKTIDYVLNGSVGYKSIYLLVSDSWRCKGGLLKDSFVSVWNPVKVGIGADVISGCAPKYVQIIPKYDTLQQRIKTVSWTFPGGIKDSSKLVFPNKIYYNKGDTFDVNLTLTTTVGCVYKFRENNLISLGDSSRMVISHPKSKICYSEKLKLSVTGNSTKFPTWSGTGVTYSADTLVGESIFAKFSDTGVAWPKVTENDRGCISVASSKSGIKIVGPKASFISDFPNYCQIPKKLTFSNTSMEDPLGTDYRWQISDSSGSILSSGTTKTFSYTTNVGQNYDVKLTATGRNGCSDTMTILTAAKYGKIDSNFTVAPNPACPGQKIQLIAKTNRGTKTSPNFFKWTFYDKKGAPVKTDTALKPTYIYNLPGDYSAKLLVWNNDGCKDSLKLKDTIHILSYSAKITVPDTMVCIGEAFKAFAYGKPKNLKLKQTWMLENIDSICPKVYPGESDSVQIYLYKTGRWTLTFKLEDTAAAGCYTLIKYPFLIKVSGSGYVISGQPDFGCDPLTTTLKSVLQFNVNYKNSTTTRKAIWKTTNPIEVSIKDTTQSTTTAYVLRGQFPVWLNYQNESGCKGSTYPVWITSGMTLDFQIPTGGICEGGKAQIRTAGSTWPQKYKFYSVQPGVKFFPSDTVREPIIQLGKKGYYDIKVIGYYNGCSDTFTQQFESRAIRADFDTPDSVTFCAPRLINIFNNSVGAVYNKWRFGDGDTTITMFNELVGHLYTRNSNSGFTISLITWDANGCSDTLVKPGFIRIIGPEPDFAITNSYGCEPLTVKFINKSKVFNRMFMDYDNGVVFDTMALLTYKYVVTDKSKKIQYFVPRMLLYDSLGCAAVKVSDDTVKVLKGPEARFSYTSANFLRKTEGCANDLLVKFTNQSKFFVRSFWDFDNDWKTDISNQNNPSWLYTKPGVFFPTIIAENFNGCRDTFKRDSIVVWEPPIAGFGESADSSCAIDPVQFFSTSTAKYNIVSYKWDFGEIPIFKDTSSQKKVVWKYSTPFDHSVSLDIVDKNGCKGQIIKNIYIFDTAGPKKPELAYITVRNNSLVDCYWRASKLGNFLQYHTYLDSITFIKRYSSYVRADTSLTWNYGSQVENKRFCFTARVEDTCNQMGKFGISHCTMVLRDTIFEPFNVQLDWLGYDWWGNELSHYNVFRKDIANGVFKKIATVKSNRQTYTDSFLCDQDYWYYIEAVHVNGLYKSRSNDLKAHPIYKKPEFAVNTTLVTVENNAYTRINWEQYPRYYRNYSYSLERSNTGLSGSFMPFYNNTALTGIDPLADINNKVNYYRVRFQDHCKVLADPGVVSNSIWLRSISADRNSTRLEWSPYKYWFSGVRNYFIQLKDVNGVFQNLKTVGPSVTRLDSIDIEKLGLDSICFRVYAIKDTATNDTSFSNELCLVPSSYMVIPNSFTPDDNGLNEIFKPMAGFIHRKSDNPQARFEFRIYNRWGQEVFLSNNADVGWNGFYQNVLCPPGIYIYTVKALGYDGVPYILKGTVMLLR